ncbi:MAG TPA: hypothetical protein VFX37_07185, partial [Pseudolabrys sp.]|nr:hypothetical protein [Pseudolabrys sp.]
MNARIVVAQANSTPVGSTPAQVIHVVKPQAGHTVIFHASFDGSVKIDFSAIANEKITFYHDNADQSLHIIFADGSQAIIEPFFDSKGTVLGNLTIEVAPGQDLDGAQFAAQFPVTDDQSVLPAAGNGGNASGADFHDPSVDPLSVPGPLGLLGPEELPPVQFHEFTNLALDESPALTLSGTLSGIVEEEQLHFKVRDERPPERTPENGDGNEDNNDLSGNDDDVQGDHHITTRKFSGELQGLVSSHAGTLTFGFANVEGQAVTTTDGTPITSLGEPVTFHIVGDKIEGVADGRVVFKLILDNTTTGHFTFTLTDQIDHPDQSHDNGHNPPGIFEETLDIDLSGAFNVHDQVTLTPITLSPDSFTVGVIDDTPVLTGKHDRATVDEDDIDTQFSQGTSPNFISSGSSSHHSHTDSNNGAATVDGDLARLVRVGADAVDAYNHGLFSFVGNLQHTIHQLGLDGLTSQGEPLTYHVQDNRDPQTGIGSETLIAKADDGEDGSHKVFTLTLNSDGTYEFQLFDQLDHQLGHGDNFKLQDSDVVPDTDEGG